MVKASLLAAQPLYMVGGDKPNLVISVIDIWISVMIIYISLPRNIAQQCARGSLEIPGDFQRLLDIPKGLLGI